MTKRRIRPPRHPDKTLAMRWCPVERDWMIFFPNNSGGRAGDILQRHMKEKRPRLDFMKSTFTLTDPSMLEELEARGFDLTTLRITIDLKETP